MRPGPVPRLVRRPLCWDLAPVEVLRLVRADAHPIALIGAWSDGSDVVSSEPALVRSPPQFLGDVLDLPGAPGAGAGGGADRARQPGTGLADPAVPAFGGGWIGYLGFGFGGEVLPVPPAPGGPRQLPAWWFGYYDHVLRRDQSTGEWWFEALWTAGREETLERRFEDLSGRPRAAAPRARGYSCGDFLLAPSAAEHKAAVGRAVEYIRRGDIFQANICLRLEAGFEGDPLDAFCQAAAVLQPPYAAFMRVPHGAVASLSPELFLRRNGRTSCPGRSRARPAVTAPAAGAAAARRAGTLGQEPRRERDDRGPDAQRPQPGLCRGQRGGSAPARCRASPGTVASGLRRARNPQRGSGDGDLIRAAFPPGSVTGAPKVRAVEIIGELEATPREVYTGAVGYRSPVAGLELNVAIRTFEFCAGRVWLGSGGGIVADSAADEEYRECLLKAGPLIRAIGGRLAAEHSLPAAGTRPGGGLMSRPSLQPRPAAGVFTSLLVADGDTCGLADHVARLEASTRQLFGKGLPGTCAGDLAAQLAGNPSGRLRITLQPAGGPLRVRVEIVPLDQPPAEVSLRPAVIEGGLGAHKWLDRRLLAAMARSMALQPGEQLLIQDADGDVLETDRANVFAVIGGVLHTPPADGRLLPGVTRDAVLRVAGVEGLGVSVTPISRARLQAASEVFVTNAVHGVQPVRSMAGQPSGLAGGPGRWPDGGVPRRAAAQPPRNGHRKPRGPPAARIKAGKAGGSRRPTHGPDRQLRLLHLQPRAHARRQRLPCGGRPQRRGVGSAGRLVRPGRRGDLTGAVRPR